ncbi:MAG: BamA/TamA family outer membrane protein [Wenzhouxiangellaceae bacterium]|nr:BamA/TamA family outer membrane protein [Wenzhouxiangellaceae bacterium]
MKHRLAIALATLLLSAAAWPRTVETEIVGVDGELLANVRSMLSLERAEELDTVSVWRLRQMASRAREEVRRALEPFGYYNANITVRLVDPEETEEADGEGGEAAPWRARVTIAPGQPVLVESVDLAISEPASELEAFEEWLAAWPLPVGAPLRHPPWKQSLSELEQIARTHGFFEGRFAERRIRVLPNRNQAEIRVDYDAGRRYVIGDVDTGDTGFEDALMQRLTIVRPGEPYDSDDIDRQREVLVRAGYFEQVVVEQKRDSAEGEVDLVYRLKKRPPNTYRALAGFGTDTGPRIQLGWTRHYLTDAGGRLDTRFGAQQTDQEFLFRTDYERPIGGRPGNFLTTGLLVKREQDRFRFEDANRIEPVFDSFGGSRWQGQVSVGRLRERWLFEEGFSPLSERLFVTFLQERFDAFSAGSLNDEQQALLDANPGLRPFLDTDTQTVALGGEWSLFRILGDGFATHGVNLRARLLGASETLGSDVTFLQGYLSGRWHWLMGERHKLLVRGEAGYTDASTRKFDLSIPGDPRQLDLEITELPELFRFKAGGDRSVRGYGYEALSTNRNGANHTLVGSVEYEYRLFDKWSAAAFYDVGNAFNDFSEPELKRGAGLGLRWYTLIGPVQLDVARALDDDSFRIHFTIGTKLL